MSSKGFNSSLNISLFFTGYRDSAYILPKHMSRVTGFQETNISLSELEQLTISQKHWKPGENYVKVSAHMGSVNFSFKPDDFQKSFINQSEEKIFGLRLHMTDSSWNIVSGLFMIILTISQTFADIVCRQTGVVPGGFLARLFRCFRLLGEGMPGWRAALFDQRPKFVHWGIPQLLCVWR